MDIAVDFEGNIFVAGQTNNEDFPVTDGSALLGPFDGFVAKMTTTGELIESTLLGGFGVRLNDDGSMSGGAERVDGIDVDPYGAVYVSGRTSADDFPTTPGAFDTDCGVDGIPDDCTEGNILDGFAAKLVDVADDVKQQRIHVSALDLDQAASLSKGWASDITVSVHGGLPLGPIQGATVTGDWAGSNKSFSKTGVTCVTDSNGQCTLSSGKIHDNNASVTFFVTAVGAPERVYVPGANHDPGDTDPDSDGSQITALNPAGGGGGGGGGGDGGGGKPCNPNKPGCNN